jgi:hypothetical protein
MTRHVERDAEVLRIEAEKGPNQDQVSRTRHGQELRESLYRPEQRCVQNIQRRKNVRAYEALALPPPAFLRPPLPAATGAVTGTRALALLFQNVTMAAAMNTLE